MGFLLEELIPKGVGSGESLQKEPKETTES